MQLEGFSQDADAMLARGLSASEILDKYMMDRTALNLSGCPLDIVYYYLDQDIPVLVQTGEESAILLTGYKDEILENHGVIKCTREEYPEFSPADYISARVNDFGAELLTADRAAAAAKYSGAIIEKTTLEEIMLFYVRRDKREWK